MKKIFVLFFCNFIFLNLALAQRKITDVTLLPKEATRVTATGFGHFLQNFSLKNANETVVYYNGKTSPLNDINGGILAIDVGKNDLLQCADAVMCLYAKYLLKIGKADKIAFHFVNGTLCDYNSYKKGFRFVNNQWKKTAAAVTDDSLFEKYLNLVYTYASTLSLEKELKKVPTWQDLKVGDIFIRGGAPGHCFIVVDKMQNKQGKTFFAIAQGFMPAQSVHILAPNGQYWFEVGKNYQNDIPYGEILSLDFLKAVSIY